MLDISHLRFGYHGKRNPLYSDFSLSLPQGHVYGILGKNGSGKSTLLYLISGLLRPQGGKIRFMGKEKNITVESYSQGSVAAPPFHIEQDIHPARGILPPRLQLHDVRKALCQVLPQVQLRNTACQPGHVRHARRHAAQ